MRRFLTFAWRDWIARSTDFRSNRGDRRLTGDTGRGLAVVATREERLERIGLYARAGYFDVNQGVGSFAWQSEIAPD